MRRAGARSLLACLPLLLAAACRIQASVGTTSREPAPPRADTREWRSKLDVAHPLVGTIWSVRAGRAIAARDLYADLAKKKLVLLGEKHDNVDHHVLQASVVRALTDAGRRPAIAFEMLDADEQPVVTAAALEHPRDPSAIAAAVRWDRKGWPPWPEYAPIGEAALASDLPIIAANLPLAEVRAIAHQGLGGIDAQEASRLGLDHEMPAALAESLDEELMAAHCGQLPASAVPRMALAQRGRDAEMAERILLAARGDGAVLIAGAGHVRLDRGVPREVARLDSTATVASVAFAEVEASRTTPAAYAERWHAASLPFDYVWFTPRASDDDPCAAFAKPR
jgi:uncharacterized iron-regulated protein